MNIDPADRSDQRRFMAVLKRSLSQSAPDALQTRPAAPGGRRPEKPPGIGARTPARRLQLLERFQQEARTLGMKVTRVAGAAAAAEAIRTLAGQIEPEWSSTRRIVMWRHPLLDRLRLRQRLRDESVPVHRAPGQGSGAEAWRRFRQRAAQAAIGITSADFCLADTATLVLRTSRDQPRTVSLLPSVHVAVVALSCLLADLAEFYALLHRNPGAAAGELSTCLTFVTGPSKTADIEATLVHGAHGPRQVQVFVLPETVAAVKR